GRTLNHTFMILDEAQNTTPTQMMMFLTRMGNSSKIVVTGDATQTDLPDHVECGLVDALRRLRGVPGIATIHLSGEDIVRHPLVRRIVAAYDVGSNVRSNGLRENPALTGSPTQADPPTVPVATVPSATSSASAPEHE
ncbi:MAG: hypothetical protein B7Z55_07485, partial [Planctomycetales bacterium 12-60-4]